MAAGNYRTTYASSYFDFVVHLRCDTCWNFHTRIVRRLVSQNGWESDSVSPFRVAVTDRFQSCFFTTNTAMKGPTRRPSSKVLDRGYRNLGAAKTPATNYSDFVSCIYLCTVGEAVYPLNPEDRVNWKKYGGDNELDGRTLVEKVYDRDVRLLNLTSNDHIRRTFHGKLSKHRNWLEIGGMPLTYMRSSCLRGRLYPDYEERDPSEDEWYQLVERLGYQAKPDAIKPLSREEADGWRKGILKQVRQSGHSNIYDFVHTTFTVQFYKFFTDSGGLPAPNSDPLNLTPNDAPYSVIPSSSRSQMITAAVSVPGSSLGANEQRPSQQETIPVAINNRLHEGHSQSIQQSQDFQQRPEQLGRIRNGDDVMSIQHLASHRH
ncbi:hypothetical protein ABKN59_010754 [Abortiporus biennis]